MFKEGRPSPASATRLGSIDYAREKTSRRVATVCDPHPQDILTANGITTPEQIKGMILKGAEQVTEGMEVILPAGFKEVFLEEVQKENTRVLLIWNHQSHPDILSVAKVSKILKEMTDEAPLPEDSRIPGFQLIIASSLADGEQGMFLQECINQMVTNFAPSSHLSTLEFMREKDLLLHVAELEKQGRKISKSELKALRNANIRTFISQLTQGVHDRKGTALFLPGSVQEGRMDKDGNIFGLGANPNSAKLDKIIELVTRADPNKKLCGEALIIFAGTHGGYQVVSPDTLSLTPGAIAAIQGGNDPIRAIQVRLSMPKRADIITSEIEAKGEKVDSASINEYSLRALAKLLPPEARGVYA